MLDHSKFCNSIQGIDPFFFSKLIKNIRHSARLVETLPTDLQRLARDSYASSLKSVFILAACASLLAYLCRLPVSFKAADLFYFIHFLLIFGFEIPAKRLDDNNLDSDNGDEDTLRSDTSSTIEEIRDDEDKIVRPCHKRLGLAV